MTNETKAFLAAVKKDADVVELIRLATEAERAEADSPVGSKYEEVYQTLQALQRELRDVWRLQQQLRRVIADLATTATAADLMS